MGGVGAPTSSSAGMKSSTAVPLWSLRSVRLRVAVLIALALTIEGLMRSNLNMAYVCMVAESQLESPKAHLARLHHDENECPVLAVGGNKTRHQYMGTLEWTGQQRAYLFPVFYVGGLAATLSTEFLNRKFGASKTVLWGAVVNVVGTLATPAIAIYLGPAALAAVRFIMGFGQGVLVPCMSVLVAAWFPAIEKSTALAIGTTGNQLSVIFSMFFTAELCQVPLFGGWPFAFYIYGILGVFLVVLWWAVVEDTPAASRCISDEEKSVIGGAATVSAFVGSKKKAKPPKTRWAALLSSPVVWSICAASFCHNFVIVGIVTYLPFYYKSALNMSLTSNGLLSSLPFICQLISKIIFSAFADTCKQRRWLSATAATKMSNSAASFGIAISLLVVAACDCSSRWAAVVAVCSAMAFISGYIPGYTTSVVTIAPSQTAGIATFSRFWAQIGMSLSPWLIGLIVQTGRVEEWRCIFFMMAGLCIISGVFFQCCGSASVQSWNNEKQLTLAGVESASANTRDDGQRLLVFPPPAAISQPSSEGDLEQGSKDSPDLSQKTDTTNDAL